MPTSATDLQAHLQALHERITKAARAAGRDPSSVRLIAVSKTFGAGEILNAAAAGQRAFGENHLQEAAAKITGLRALRPDLAFEWHFIGPIQSNKTLAIAERFDWVQSVDRLKIAERLSAQRSTEQPALNVLLQVNVSGEATKAGVAPDQLGELASAVAPLPRLRLRGIMAIPAPETDAARQRAAFAQTNMLFRRLREDGLKLDVLSMGMSDDLEAAIAEGSTMIRVGTAIFGTRTSQ